MYILDTSALRGIGKDKLIKIKTLYDIAISPISFYELLCHLDEGRGEDSFVRKKGQIMKCAIPRILHDPFAYHAISIGAMHVANTTRFEDSTIVAKLLLNLEQATSLKEFYASSVVYPNGEKAQCSDIAKNCRDVFDDETRKYLQHLDIIRKNILKFFPDCPQNGLTTSELSSTIKGTINQLISEYRTKDKITDELLPLRVVSSIYMNKGYTISRVIKYMQKAHNSGTDFIPDPNDCEDSYISMYLELFKCHTLVTDDDGTLIALNETRKAFQESFDNSLKIKSQVLSKNEFINEIEKISNKIVSGNPEQLCDLSKD